MAIVLLVLVGGRGSANPSTWACAVPVSVLPLLVVIDLVEYRLPDVVVIPSGATAAFVVIISSWTISLWPEGMRALLAGAVSVGVLFVLFMVSGGALGFGDVKLGFLLGTVVGGFGWWALLAAFFVSSVIGLVMTVGYMAVKRQGLKTSLPFGPALLIGTAAVSIVAVV